jgi:predicted aspartyl protease
MPRIDYQLVAPYRLIPDGTGGLITRPCLAVVVTGPHGQVDIVAHVDSGSYYVVFDGQIAEAIGLNLANGEYKELGPPTGVVPARLHDVTMEIEGYRFPCRAAFTEVPIRRACLLGRAGFFNLWQIGFREAISELYLSPDPLALDLVPGFVQQG